MKRLVWNAEKALLLRNNSARGNVSFEECVIAIESNKILDDIENPSRNHPNQRLFVLEIDGYAYAVPYVESEKELFLKTVFPSRKLTALYLAGGDHEKEA
ncbi:MAG TPA: toxin [Gammaproteobacteria bacterium]|nr:toxin [Gammaproteobacteria bacterium]